MRHILGSADRPVSDRRVIDRTQILYTFVPPKGPLVLWRDHGGTGTEQHKPSVELMNIYVANVPYSVKDQDLPRALLPLRRSDLGQDHHGQGHQP